jgi:hypothetical protein
MPIDLHYSSYGLLGTFVDGNDFIFVSFIRINSYKSSGILRTDPYVAGRPFQKTFVSGSGEIDQTIMIFLLFDSGGADV